MASISIICLICICIHNADWKKVMVCNGLLSFMQKIPLIKTEGSGPVEAMLTTFVD